MTTYVQGPDGQYYTPENEPMPSFKHVGASRLEIGSIIFRQSRYDAPYITSVVTAVDREVDERGNKGRWKVTLVDGAGGIDVVRTYAGGKDFKLQCSDEELEAMFERQRNIALRRKIAAINSEVCSARDAVKAMARPRMSDAWYRNRKDKGVLANPKVKSYVERFDDFAAQLQEMYEEIGRDLGLASKKEKVDPNG